MYEDSYFNLFLCTSHVADFCTYDIAEKCTYKVTDYKLFGGILSAKSLQKYLFLFTRGQSAKSFEFVPYTDGCFSFQAAQDIATMAKYGYLELVEHKEDDTIYLVKKQDYLLMLKESDVILLEDVKLQYGALTQNELIRYIYLNFPFFAINSTIAKELLSDKELIAIDSERPNFSKQKLFSIGYEGITLEEYINKLIINNVHVLCDVRKNAFSQKFGFSKSQLQRACNGVGIRYLHIRELGIESKKRQMLQTQDDYDTLFENYSNTTLKENREALMKIRELIELNKRVAVTCFEKDPQQCHRSYVTKALMQLPEVNYSLEEL